MECKPLPTFIQIIQHANIGTESQLKRYYDSCIHRKYEGVVLNNIDGLYKHGRSTLKEGLALKMKPKLRDEARIIELIELKDATGKPQNTFGAAVVERKLSASHSKPEYVLTNVGTGPGLTAERRQEIWDNQWDYLHKMLTVEYDSITKYGKFRFPRWIGIRHEGTE